MELVAYQRKMAPLLADIMRESVYTVCAKDYTPEEIALWVPRHMDMVKFSRSLQKGVVVVAVMGEKIVGFANMDPDGYLNRLYTKPEYMGMGVGSALLAEIEERARVRSCPKVFLHSSLTARGFYEKHGYRCLGESGVHLRSGNVPGFKMEKNL